MSKKSNFNLNQIINSRSVKKGEIDGQITLQD